MATQTYADRLQELLRLIRIGLPERDPAALTEAADRTLKARIDEQLAHLERLDQPDSRKNVLEVLRYKSLKAEYEFNFGRVDGTAAEELGDFLDKRGIIGRLDAWSPRENRFLARSDDSKLVRQKIWALMAVAFFRDYSKGKILDAIGRLEKIERVIESELPDGSDGSRTRVHEFLAQCYRTLHQFARAHDHFTEAQRYAERRLRRIMRSHDHQARQEGYQFGVICTARVIGGLGRLALLRGQLRQAQVMLRSARTLVRPTGQARLKNVIASHLAITERRLCSPFSPKERARCIARLEALHARFEDEHDQDGARRCVQDLARAYLESAEVLPSGEQRAKHLHRSEHWIGVLETLASRRANGGGDSIEHFRALLLKAWYRVLATPASVATGRAEVERARKMLEKNPEYCLDLRGFDSIDVRLTAAIVEAAGTEERIVAAENVAHMFRDLVSNAQKAADKVLEAEATLRWIPVEVRAGRLDSARRLLEGWTSYRPFVSSGFIEALASKTLDAIKVPALYIESLDWYEELDRLKDLLFSRAVQQSGGVNSHTAKALGVTPDQFKTIKKDRLRAKQREQGRLL